MTRTNVEHEDLYNELYEQAIDYLRANRFTRTVFDGLVNHIFQNQGYWINHPEGMRKAFRKLNQVTRRVRVTQRQCARKEVLDAVAHIQSAHAQFEAEKLFSDINEMAHRFCPGSVKTLKTHFFNHRGELNEALLLECASEGLVCGYTRQTGQLVIVTRRGKILLEQPQLKLS